MNKQHHSSNHPEVPNEGNEHKNRDSEQSERVMGRRTFFGNAAKGVAGLFGAAALTPSNVYAQHTDIDSLLSDTAKDNLKKIEENNEEINDMSDIGNTRDQVTDALLELASHLSLRWGGVGAGYALAEKEKVKTKNVTENRFRELERKATNTSETTPDLDAVVKALTNLKKTSKNKMESAHLNQERLRDTGIVTDWLVWLFRKGLTGDHTNPLSGEIGGQLMRVAIGWYTLTNSELLGSARKTRMEAAKTAGKSEADAIVDDLEHSSETLKAIIAKAQKNDAAKQEGTDKTAKEAEAKKQEEESHRRAIELEREKGKNEQVKLEKAHELAERTEERKAQRERERVRQERLFADELRIQQEHEQLFAAKRKSLGSIAGADVNDADLYADLKKDHSFTDSEIGDMIEKAKRLGN